MDALLQIYDKAAAREQSVTEETLAQVLEENSELGAHLHLSDGPTSSVITNIKPVPYQGSKYGSMFANGVVVLDMIGPIYPRANMMTSYSGAVSLQQFVSDYVRAMNDPDVTGIVLNIDSPGGDVRGLADGTAIMYQLSSRGKKPVKSFASGYMASAAYYIGATSQELIGSKSSVTGSIGTVLSGRKLPDGHYEITSSQSPNKRVDPTTEEGKAIVTEMLDDMCQLFIDDVAKYRGIDSKTVLSNYGQGKTFVGPRAKSQGLLDGLGTLSSVIESVAKEAQNGSYRQVRKRKMSSEVANILSFTDEEITDMKLTDLVKKFRASDDVLIEALDAEQSQLDSAVDEDMQIEETGTTEDTEAIAPVIGSVAMQARREELEDSFSEGAELFATQMTIESRIFPAQQGYAASDLLIARIDDSIHGGTVNHINAEGEVVQGTREEAVRARYAALPKHTLAQQAVKGVKAGDAVGVVLAEEPSQPKVKEADTEMTPERRAQLLNKTSNGQRILANTAAE